MNSTATRKQNATSGAIVVLLTLAYAIAFNTIYHHLGIAVAALAVVPVAAAGFLFGKRMGTAAGVVLVLLNVLLFNGAGVHDVHFHVVVSFLPAVMTILIGTFGGWLSDLARQSKRQAEQLQREGAERRKSEEELRVSRERLEVAIDGADLGLWDVDVASDTVVFNARWAEMLGYTPEELGTKATIFWDLTHPEDVGSVREALEAHLRGESAVFETEHRMKTRSGAWRWILNRGKTVERDDNGKPRRVAGTHIDITERKKNEERLHLLERAIDATRNGIVITDPALPDNPIIFVNPAYTSGTGYSREEVLGRNPRFLQGDETDRSTTRALGQALRRGEQARAVVR
ncbi:MAG TPA: PAS domain S-box protein, partial [Bacteroidota bacterium]|nr:PAS domain S-box protein [Bacteroidota bacterium]